MSATLRDRLSRLTVVALTAFMLGGCGGQWSAVVDPGGIADPSFMITWVTVSTTQFRIGEPMQIEVGFKNPTRRPIRVHFTSGCRAFYAVRDGNDAVVAPKAFLCTTEARTVVFAPGETGSQTFTWDGTVSPGEDLAPGDYRVAGGLTEGIGQPAAPVTIQLLARE